MRGDQKKNSPNGKHRDDIEQDQPPDIAHHKKGLQALDEIVGRHEIGENLDPRGHAGDFKEKAGEDVGGQKSGDDGDLRGESLVLAIVEIMRPNAERAKEKDGRDKDKQQKRAAKGVRRRGPRRRRKWSSRPCRERNRE